MVRSTLNGSAHESYDRRMRGRGCDERSAVSPSWLVMFVLLPSIASSPCYSQAPRLIDVEPYDVIILNAQNDNLILKVLPLDLPDRVVPRDPSPSDPIRVRLVSNPEEELDVSWSGIDQIQLFEQRVLAEAREMIENGKFDDAFEAVTFVHDRFPKTPGLDETVDRLLYTEASSLFREGTLERSLLLLDELHQRDPDRRGLSTAMNRVLERTFDQHIKARELQQARRLYDFVDGKYSPLFNEMLTGWRQQLESLGAGVVQQMQIDMDAGRWRDAYVAGRRVLNFWPSTPRAADLMQIVSNRYPLIRVAVLQEAPKSPVKDEAVRMNWSARRVDRLQIRRLFELEGVGPDGGLYGCNVGTSEESDDNRSITIRVATGESGGLTGVRVAQMLLQRGRPGSRLFDPIWAALMDHVDAADVATAVARFRRPGLRAAALLVVPLDQVSSIDEHVDWRPYLSGDRRGPEQRYLVNPRYIRGSATQPREVVEHVYATPQRALSALRRGDVDMLDRVFPADVERLRRDPEFIVKPYRVPSLHALIPNYDRPYTANRLFRRGLLYAIDRDQILRRDLLAGTEVAGCQVVSGPFSPGVTTDDPVAYGYDPQIQPRAYDPRHAKTLLQLSQVELAAIADEAGRPVPSQMDVILVRPAAEVARIACAEIAEDFKVIGLPCSIRVLEPGQCRPDDDDWDLLYVDYVAPEPLVDAVHLFASHGFVGSPNSHLNLAVRQVERVENWNRAGERLQVIHQLCFDDTTLLPLWQIVDHMAYRKGIQGIVQEPVTTYQKIEAWQTASRP